MIASACVKFHTRLDSKFMGTVFDIPCHRHGDAFYIISQFVDPSEIDKTKTEQGFMTNDDRFLDRYDAMQHAIACGQLPPDADKECKELYSEDLW
jgi:hypothetical protein